MLQEVGNLNSPNEKVKTLYNWCLDKCIRINDENLFDDGYMTEKIDLASFYNILDLLDGDFYENMVPIKPDKYLELRMYGLGKGFKV